MNFKPLLAFILLLVSVSSAAALDLSPVISLTASGTSVDTTATLTVIGIDPDTSPNVADMAELKLLRDGVEIASSSCAGTSGTCVLVHVEFFGTDATHTYTATATDDDGHTVTSSSVTIFYEGANVPPIFTDIPDFVVIEDSGLTSSLLDLWDYATDIETPDSGLTFTILTETLPATVDCDIVSGHIIDCTTVADATGTSEITVEVSDGDATGTGSFNVTVTPVNDPVLIGTTLADVSFPEDTSIIVALGPAFTDVDSPILTYTIGIGTPVIINSTLTGTSLNLSGLLNLNGNTTVTVNATDGEFSASQTFGVEVTPVNDAPAFTLSASYSWPEDTTFTLDLSTTSSDIDSADIDWSVSGTTFITVSINQTTGIATLVPAGNFTGIETATFTATDGLLNTSVVTTLNVTPVNDAPVFNESMPLANITIYEDVTNSTIDLSLAYFDIDSSDLNWTSVVTGNITVSIDQITGVVNVTSLPNATGSGTIVFTATDGSLSSSPSNTVFVDILPVNDGPFLIGTIPNMTFAEDGFGSMSLLPFFGDIDNSSLLYTAISDNPSILPTVLPSGTLNVTALADFFGTGNLTITASDGEFGVLANIVVVIVSAVDDAPFLSTPLVNVTFPEETSTTFDLAPFFTDVDNSTLLFSSSFNASQVNVSILGSNATITGMFDYFGVSPITFTASDGTSSASGSMTATVTNVDDAPRLVSDIPNQTWTEDTVITLNITPFWIEVDGQDLNWTVSGTTSVVVTVDNATGIATFTPPLDFVGVDSVVFTATDGALTNDSNIVTLTLLPFNDAPVYVGPIANVTMVEDTIDESLSVFAAFTDVDSPDLNWTVTAPVGWIVSVNSTTGIVTIDTPVDFFGIGNLTFFATDGLLTSGASDTVFVNVTGTPDSPVFTPPIADMTMTVGTLFSYTASAFDADGDVLTYSDNTTDFDIVNATGLISFTPISEGVILANISACDLLFCTEETFTITVGPVPAPAPSGGGGGGGGGGGSRGSSSAPPYNITAPVLFPTFIEDTDDGSSSSNGTSSSGTNTTVIKPLPVVPKITGATIIDSLETDSSVGFMIILGILVFGLLGYFVVRKLME